MYHIPSTKARVNNPDLIDAAQFMIPHLGLEQYHISIQVVPLMGARGQCRPGNRGSLLILLNMYLANPQAQLNGEKAIEQVLAHELIHCQQFKTGKLVAKNVADRLIVEWDGQRPKDYSNISHEFRPWEIEAYSRELGIYQAWNQSRVRKTA